MPRAPSSSPRTRRPVALAVVTLALALGVVLPLPPERPPPPERGRAAADLRALAWAFSAYVVDTGTWPAAQPEDLRLGARRELVELDCLMRDTHGLPGWSGPYLDLTRGIAAGSLVDPWGRPYLVCYLPASIELYSCGPDGVLNSRPGQAGGGRAGGDDLLLTVTTFL